MPQYLVWQNRPRATSLLVTSLSGIPQACGKRFKIGNVETRPEARAGMIETAVPARLGGFWRETLTMAAINKHRSDPQLRLERG
jgi:hypothetical protein